jgi:Tol biopolymer transport system component
MGGASTTRIRTTTRTRLLAGVTTGAAAAAAVAAGTPAGAVTTRGERPGVTRLVSATATGAAAAGESEFAALSDDGRVVAFVSSAPDLVPGDTNGVADVFVRDLRTGRTTRVSVSSTGEQADVRSSLPSLSRDGRYVAFESLARNLVPGDTNNIWDSFVHDVKTGVTQRVSVNSAGEEADQGGGRPVISGNGRHVAFYSTAGNLVDAPEDYWQHAYLRNLGTGETRRIDVGFDGSPLDGFATSFDISDDGRRVVFESFASNIVKGDTNEQPDIFLYDDRTRRSTRVSVGARGAQSNSYSFGARISGNGKIVAFGSAASNLVPDDTNTAFDAFVHDTRNGRTTRVSVTGTGAELPQGGSLFDLSNEGDEVVFDTMSPAVPSDTNEKPDIYLRDTDDRTTTRISLGRGGAQPDGFNVRPVVSGDGKTVAWESGATNLVPGDRNGARDIYLRDLRKVG